MSLVSGALVGGWDRDMLKEIGIISHALEQELPDAKRILTEDSHTILMHT